MYDGLSHSNTAQAHGLKAEAYREFEWLADAEDTLRVRTRPEDPYPESSYRAAILARFPTRARLIRYWLERLPKRIDGDMDVSGCDLRGIALPEEIVGSLDVSGCDLHGVALPKWIGSDLYARGCALTGVTWPTWIGGNLIVRGCDLAGVTWPEDIGGWLDVSGCDLRGVTLPEDISDDMRIRVMR